MDEPLSHVVEDNTEEIVKQFYGADEATATVEREIKDPKKFMMEVTFEGEIENTDEVFFYESEMDDEEVQYLKVINVVNDFILLASYTMVRRSELQKIADEIEISET